MFVQPIGVARRGLLIAVVSRIPLQTRSSPTHAATAGAVVTHPVDTAAHYVQTQEQKNSHGTTLTLICEGPRGYMSMLNTLKATGSEPLCWFGLTNRLSESEKLPIWLKISSRSAIQFWLHSSSSFPFQLSTLLPSSQFSPCLDGSTQMWQATPLKTPWQLQEPLPLIPSKHCARQMDQHQRGKAHSSWDVSVYLPLVVAGMLESTNTGFTVGAVEAATTLGHLWHMHTYTGNHSNWIEMPIIYIQGTTIKSHKIWKKKKSSGLY